MDHRTQQSFDLVVREHIGRVGEADHQRTGFLFQHDGAKTPRLGFRQTSHQRRVELAAAQVDELDVHLPRDHLGDLVVGDEAQIAQRVAESATGLLLFVQCLRQLRRCQQVGGDQCVAEPEFLGCAHVIAFGSFSSFTRGEFLFDMRQCVAAQRADGARALQRLACQRCLAVGFEGHTQPEPP